MSSWHQIISTLCLIAFRCTSSKLKGVWHKTQFRQVCGYCNAEKIWKLSFFEHSIKIIWCPERDLMTADIYSIIGDHEFLTSNYFEPAPKKLSFLKNLPINIRQTFRNMFLCLTPFNSPSQVPPKWTEADAEIIWCSEMTSWLLKSFLNIKLFRVGPPKSSHFWKIYQ